MTPTLEALEQAFVRLLAPAPALEGNPGAEGGMATADPAADRSGAVSTGTPVFSLDPASVPTCRIVRAPARGCHFEAFVRPDGVVDAARVMDSFGFAPDTITAVDWIAAGEMEVVYDFYHPFSWIHAVVRCRVPRSDAELPTISGVYPGANWHERETHDFFGIRFAGHPDLTPLLLPEDADYHPLRKDFGRVA